MLAQKIRDIIEGEVKDDKETRKHYSHDASIFEVTPEVVVFPKHVKDVKALVKLAEKEREKGEDVSITARSGGTDMSGGPLGESIVVDFSKHMNQFKEVREDEDGGSAVVEPGMFYRDFEKETLKKNLLVPSYPASREICTVGGMVANNSGGEDTLAYGKTEEYINRLSVVLADGSECTIEPLTRDELSKKEAQNDFEGRIYKKLHALLERHYDEIKAAKPAVTKNSAGYYLWNVWDKERGVFDLTKLITGSQGTLCLVTEIEFRLIRKPIQEKGHSHLAVIFLSDVGRLGEIIKETLTFSPESFESYDDKTLKLALRFLPDLAARMGARNIFSLGIQFIPEFFMMLRGGIPKLVLLAELVGEDDKKVHAQLRALKEKLSKFDVRVRLITREKEAKKYWVIRRESFNLLRHRVKGKHAAPFIDDIIVKPEHLATFLPKLQELLDPYSDVMTYTIAGHAGDGNFHIIPLMDFSDEEAIGRIPEVSEKVYDLVLRFGGSITAEHNDGLIRTPYLEKMYGRDIVKLFEETKRIFDPSNIFNPRKKVGGTLKYAMSHVRKEY